MNHNPEQQACARAYLEARQRGVKPDPLDVLDKWMRAVLDDVPMERETKGANP